MSTAVPSRDTFQVSRRSAYCGILKRRQPVGGATGAISILGNSTIYAGSQLAVNSRADRVNSLSRLVVQRSAAGSLLPLAKFGRTLEPDANRAARLHLAWCTFLNEGRFQRRLFFLLPRVRGDSVVSHGHASRPAVCGLQIRSSIVVRVGYIQDEQAVRYWSLPQICAPAGKETVMHNSSAEQNVSCMDYCVPHKLITRFSRARMVP